MYAAKEQFTKFIHLKNDSIADTMILSLHKSSSKDVRKVRGPRIGGSSTNVHEEQMQNIQIPIDTHEVGSS